MEHKFTNDLINETSPYLLQHAHNPVNWMPWNTKALEKAKNENKLIIISVGYSACHWCHVMEEESFEDEEVAKIMNTHFVNIKVDREERPDVDQVYMTAVQLLTGSGGWPLNVIALPDSRPVWGGTYFKKEQWTKALNQIAQLYKDDPEKLEAHADQLEQGIKNADLVTLNTDEASFSNAFIEKTIDKWSRQFDHREGGLQRSPKFMMPNNYQFLLRYAYQLNDEKLQEFVNLTLTQMAYGGVYDHIGGGFSRYATDVNWHVPHFEKMLYDNGQLVSLYADAYLITKNELYKEVIVETLEFVKRELTNEEGGFYSSLDADSKTPENELEEGAFYVWKKDELKTLLAIDFELFADYYNINNYGLWEHGNYVLIRKTDDATFLKKHKLTSTEFNDKKNQWKQLLFKQREKRQKPRLDDKTLTSWNAIMLKGYVDAYRVLGDSTYLQTAINNANFIEKQQLRDDGGLNHSYKNGQSTINGYLEDYAATIDAFLNLYEATLNDKWLHLSRDLTLYSFDHFFDAQSKMFYFTSNEDDPLVARTIEYRDNVIPASNSIMAKNLFKLAHYFDNDHFRQTATTLLNNVKPEMQDYGPAYSNWLDLMLNFTQPYYEVAISGEEALVKKEQLNRSYIPNKLIVGSTSESHLPLLENRYVDGETYIYVCVNKACKLPVKSVEQAVSILKN
ncbi:thioredoxin domain-containing protein [Geojedonia litorea]|uniref:Thioredoxin domain-containing protein n=1 Tax=Geojedonia litorea TaxID=1268269 RepID=A0ABV9N085_9FLAO